MIHTDIGVLCSLAYDLLNVNLIYPEDKEDLALTLNGRQRKIKRTDFDQFTINIGLTTPVRDNIYKDFSKQFKEVHQWIESSFLTDEYKERYVQILDKKRKQIS